MQRVRIGLTGLAFVFLAVLLAAVFTNQTQDELPITPNLIEQQGIGPTAAPAPGQTENQPAEPLAQLGVAPGAVDSNAATPQSAPPSGSAPPPASVPPSQ